MAVGDNASRLAPAKTSLAAFPGHEQLCWGWHLFDGMYVTWQGSIHRFPIDRCQLCKEAEY